MAFVRRRNVSKLEGKYATKVPQRCHEAAVSPLRAYRDRSDIFGPGIPAYKKACVSRTQKECSLELRWTERMVNVKRKVTNQRKKERKYSRDVLTKRIIDRAVNTNVVGHRFVVQRPVHRLLRPRTTVYTCKLNETKQSTVQPLDVLKNFTLSLSLSLSVCLSLSLSPFFIHNGIPTWWNVHNTASSSFYQAETWLSYKQRE